MDRVDDINSTIYEAVRYWWKKMSAAKDVHEEIGGLWASEDWQGLADRAIITDEEAEYMKEYGKGASDRELRRNPEDPDFWEDELEAFELDEEDLDALLDDDLDDDEEYEDEDEQDLW